MCSIQGALTMGIIGFGWSLVSGLRRVPCPPAMITAFIGTHPVPENIPSTSRARTSPPRRTCSLPILRAVGKATGLALPTRVLESILHTLPVRGAKTRVARPRFRAPREPCRCPEPRCAVRTVREPPLQGSALATALYPYPYADAP